jgi:hypothetical protein
MKAIFLKLSLIVFFLLCSEAKANGVDGNKMIKYCKAAVEFDASSGSASEKMGIGFCLGFVSGVTNTLTIYGEKYYCPPDFIPPLQAARIVTKYLEDNPAKLHENSLSLTLEALLKAYPCPS